MRIPRHIALLPVILLAACTTILPLADDAVQMARFTCLFHWADGDNAEERPDSITLALLRTYNSVHDIRNIASESDDTISVAFGEYLALAAGSSPRDAYSLQYLGENPDSSRWDPAGLYSCLPTVPFHQIDSLFGSHTWTDQSYPIVAEARPLYLAKVRRELLDATTVEQLEFDASGVTQQITFRVTINTAPGIVIDTVSASISGIARRIQVISSAVSNDNEQLGQTLFPLAPVNGSNGYEGTIGCLGIFPSGDEEYEYSPGVLRLHIHAALGSVSRYVDARINLKHQIEEAALLADPDGTGFFTIATRKADLVIETPLEITENQILAEGEVYLEWIDHEIDEDENGDPLQF